MLAKPNEVRLPPTWPNGIRAGRTPSLPNKACFTPLESKDALQRADAPLTKTEGALNDQAAR
jgi:hypothetical protein